MLDNHLGKKLSYKADMHIFPVKDLEMTSFGSCLNSVKSEVFCLLTARGPHCASKL
jgi:hypothetical protein